jgi:nitroimidazol reductase NimA-like FMN-containing flavoprotein (pyridoxamine 5'-phosphate oxidase superfamily)
MATDNREDLDALVANELSDEEMEGVLHEAGTGILSLARGGESYAVPISFGYDGEQCYFVFVGYHQPSLKEAFAESTATATLSVYEVEDVSEWHSVVVRGRIERIEEDWTDGRAAIGDNAWYPSLFRGADPRGNVAMWTLIPDEVTGYASQ